MTVRENKDAVQNDSGFTIIEVLIATFIIGVVVVGLFGLFILSLRTVQDNERRIVAIALANEKMELVRNLPYVDVGTLGGVPSGSLLQEEVIARNNLSYTVTTDIRYVDDPHDGLAGGDPNDLLNTDYKQVRVEVSWNSPTAVRPILLITFVVPQGIEGGEIAGTLIFEALNANGDSIVGASVNIVNDEVDPVVNIATQTNDEGRVIAPGLLESAGSYQLAVSRDGYTSEQTYDETGIFSPDPNHAHLTAIQGEITEKTFLIDLLSSASLTTKNALGVVLGGVDFNMHGTKFIGEDNDGETVYMFDEDGTTDGGGLSEYQDMVWDSYEITVDGVLTGYDIKESSKSLPLDVGPGEHVDMDIVLVPHTDLSLHLTIVDILGELVEGATATFSLDEYSEELVTGEYGQVFFSDLPNTGSYTLVVEADGYELLEQPVIMNESLRVYIDLTALGI